MCNTCPKHKANAERLNKMIQANLLRNQQLMRNCSGPYCRIFQKKR